MRLVIIVEDLDRLQSSRFEQQEIQALLFRLRRYPSLSFVITGGISVRSGIDYNRLCDRIEYLPALPHEECLDIIVLYRELMLDDYPNNLYPTVTSDNPWMAQRMFAPFRTSTPSHVSGMVRLLRTPRNLKCVLRQTTFIWQAINGEVDFDHLLVMVALRHAANEAFGFLIDNRQHVEEPVISTEEMAVLRPRLQSQWAITTANATWDVVAVQSLLRFLSPRLSRLLDTDDRGIHVTNTSSRIQGIEDRQYLQRILNESLDEGEPSDQSVLAAMNDWIHSPNVDNILVLGLSNHPSFCASLDVLCTKRSRVARRKVA